MNKKRKQTIEPHCEMRNPAYVNNGQLLDHDMGWVKIICLSSSARLFRYTGAPSYIMAPMCCGWVAP